MFVQGQLKEDDNAESRIRRRDSTARYLGGIYKSSHAFDATMGVDAHKSGGIVNLLRKEGQREMRCRRCRVPNIVQTIA